MEAKDIIVFSDFDGTITTKDSFLVFLKYYFPPVKFWIGALVLSPILVAQKLGLIHNGRAKQMVFTYFFKNESKEKFQEKSVKFSTLEIDKTLIPMGVQKLLWHKSQNHLVVVVSASFEEYLKPWCSANGFDVIATRVEVKNGLLTGKFDSKNCYGKEKVVRIKEMHNLEDYSVKIGYGDTKGDLPMLEICDESYFRHFNS